MNYLCLMAVAFSVCANIVVAATPEERGLEIAEEFDRRDLGYIDYIADMEMILINSQGESSQRLLRTKTLEVEREGESERRILVFDYPNDVKGTVLLTVSQKNKNDDQWIYFPAVKRVKRISSSNRSGPFMGSEFSYEDFSAPVVEKYTYKYLREEACGQLVCHVFERFPVEKNSGYSKQVLWVDKDEYRLWRIHFFDRKASLLKTLKIDGYQAYKGNYWRPQMMTMENIQTKKQTVLNWADYKFSVGLKKNEFIPASLPRIR